MYLQSIASRVPQSAFTQRDCWDAIRAARVTDGLKERSQNILERVLTGDNGIEQRHFACDDLTQLFDRDAETLNRDFEREAPLLACGALTDALVQAELRVKDLDALMICTCTGYLCPGLSSYVSEMMGLERSAYLQDIVGLGCGAAIPTLRSASHLIGANPDATVAVIAVEICSAAFYVDDDPGVLISLCLFGDGASASIWSGQTGATGLQASHFDTIHIPEDRELLRFENRGGKLRNKLHRTVPEKAASAVSQLYQRRYTNQPVISPVMIGSSLACDEGVDYVLSHGGGRDVLEAIAPCLPGQPLTESLGVLRDYGNLSSPSVLFALERYMEAPTDANRPLWLTSFGAGFAAHSMRLSGV